MIKENKLLAKAANNPQGLSFSDFQLLMKRCDWQLDQQFSVKLYIVIFQYVMRYIIDQCRTVFTDNCFLFLCQGEIPPNNPLWRCLQDLLFL